MIAVGGGAVLDPANRVALRGAGTVVWLRARPDTLARRVGRHVNRPLLSAAAQSGKENPVEALMRIDGERRSIYEEVASVVVDVDGITPGAAADRVVGAIAPVRDKRDKEVQEKDPTAPGEGGR